MPENTVSIREAKTQLSRLIAEMVDILSGLARPARLGVGPALRRFGAMRGRARVDAAFLEPLPESELTAWE